MQTLWHQLAAASAQIQTLTTICGFVVACLVGWVAWRQKRAAEAQAEAAEKQTAAAETQADAARLQVEAAKQQIATSLRIADTQTAPILDVVTATLAGVVVKGAFGIKNLGSGPALECAVYYRDRLPGFDDLRIPTNVLGVGQETSVVIDGQRAAASGIQLKYATVFGSKWELEFQWNGLIHQAINRTLKRLDN